MPGARGDLSISFYTNGRYDPALALAGKAWFMTKERLNQMEVPIGEIVGLFAREIETNFIVQGRPQPWEPITENTASHKQGRKQILIDTGAMMEAASDPHSWRIFRTAYNQVVAEMPEPADYAHFHLEGTKNMPQRDFLFIPAVAVADIDAIFDTWVAGVALESLA